ncbi:MAG: hypothetical protein ACREQ9_06885 [Candidatus Binatia bacterium]
MGADAGRGGAIIAPLSLGFSDCLALVLGAALMAVAVLWPGRSRNGA